MITHIGKYNIQRKIGSGSTATVYLAERDGETVALKVLHQHLVQDEVILERFRREVLIARTLEHPGIVRIYDFVAWEDQAALVMEYCPGGNIGSCPAPDPKAAVDLAARIAEALAYSHAKGIVHRDLKPENLLLDAEGRVKLCDFGSAHVQNLLGLTTSTMFAGTPLFVAPELLAGNFADPRSDFYSLGAILYQLLTGKQHRDNSVAALLKTKHQPHEPSEFPSGVPAWFAAIIINLLDDIERRIPDAGTLLYLLTHQQPPGERKVKACLFCGRAMAEASTICLECGRPELQLESDYSADAQCLVLHRISDNADIQHHVLSILQALSGDPNLELKFITGDGRLYSKAERKSGVMCPVRVIDNLPGKLAAMLIALLQSTYNKRLLHFQSRLMSSLKKIKRGPLIQLKQGTVRVETAENFLSLAAVKRVHNETSDNAYLFNRMAEAGYHLLKKTAVLPYAAQLNTVLIRLLDTSQTAITQLHAAEEYLDSVSLGALYNERIRIEHLLQKCDNTVEIQTLLERKLEQQRLYEKYQTQEARYGSIKNSLLALYGRLLVLGDTIGEQPAAAGNLQSSIEQLSALLDSNK